MDKSKLKEAVEWLSLQELSNLNFIERFKRFKENEVGDWTKDKDRMITDAEEIGELIKVVKDLAQSVIDGTIYASEEEIEIIIGKHLKYSRTSHGDGVILLTSVKDLSHALSHKLPSQKMMSEGGQALFNDLCRRLINRILTFSPDEHDIELNLCGIIEKAKRADKPAPSSALTREEMREKIIEALKDVYEYRPDKEDLADQILHSLGQGGKEGK